MFLITVRLVNTVPFVHYIKLQNNSCLYGRWFKIVSGKFLCLGITGRRKFNSSGILDTRQI